MKRIGVLTSGGDAPGMNACIRSVVRSAVYRKIEVFGFYKGYEGLINNSFEKMGARSVSNILSKGGTILKTARSSEFRTPEGRIKAARTLKRNRIDGLVVIGGNGSYMGAHVLAEEHNIKVIGAPGTIDNDIHDTDYTIGASTALNTALDAIDKIRDTVTSMERIYVVEVMGRKEAFLAIRVGLAGGAEDILYPSNDYQMCDICDDIIAGRKKGKVSWIVVVSEGAAKASDVSELIKEETGFEVRPIVLGHVQRGGSPEAFDRILASRMGAKAVEALVAGETDKSVGIRSDEMCLIPLTKAYTVDKKKAKLEKELYDLTKILAI